MSIWQTKEWQNMLKESKGVEKTFEIKGFFVEKRKVALGEYGLFILGCDFEKLTLEIQNELIELSKKEKALFIQIEDIDYLENNKTLKTNLFREGYYKKFITPYTAIIDLTKTEEEILSGMKQKGRYNIKLAEKKGVIIKEVDKNIANIEIFYNLMMETTKRDSFSSNTLKYYEKFLSVLPESKLLHAEYNGNIIAAGIFTYSKDIAIYYYGASTSDSEFRNIMSPYLLQWAAIKIGKKNGCKLYDFLGVATPGDDKSSLAGVTDFKKKFTQDIREVSRSYVYVNKKIKYYLIGFLRRFK